MDRRLFVFLDGELLPLHCRMHLCGRNEMTLSPTLFQLDLYLPSENIAGQLSTGKKIAVHSTFESVLATGSILDVLSETREGRQITSVIFSDGLPFANSFVSASFPAGASLRTITEQLLSASSVTQPLTGFTATDKVFPLGTSFFGSTADSLQSLAVDLNANVFLFRSGIYMLGRDSAPDTIDLTPEDVLDAVSSGKDVRILTTSMKGWPIGSMLRFGDLQGQILCQTFDADTGEGAWSTKVILRGISNE